MLISSEIDDTPRTNGLANVANATEPDAPQQGLSEQERAILKEANSIAGEMASAKDPDVLQKLKGDLGRLLSALPPSSVLAPQIQAMMNAAQETIAQENASDVVSAAAGAASKLMAPPIAAWEKLAIQTMSSEEFQFYNSIDPNKVYKLVEVGVDGEVKTTSTGEPQTREVTGAEIKSSFALLKDTANQMGQPEGVFATTVDKDTIEVKQPAAKSASEIKQPEASGTIDMSQATTPAEREAALAKPSGNTEIAPLKPGMSVTELKDHIRHVRRALKNMEEHKAAETMANNSPEQAHEKIRHRHRKFEKAHDQAENLGELYSRYEEMQKDTKTPPKLRMAGIQAVSEQIKLNERELGKTIQNDVINDALLEMGGEGRRQERTAEQQIAQLTAASRSVDHMGIPNLRSGQQQGRSM